MFKFDRDTIPYHISNLIFYLFSLVVLGFLFYFAFLPPLLDATNLFANFGIGEAIGMFFFLIVVIIPLLVLYGAAYHLYKLITFNKNNKTATE